MIEQRLNYLIAGTFVALIFLTIIFVTAILPATTFTPEATAAAHKYTAQELRGRNIYRREGCFYCHSQFTRYQDREYGEVVQAGDYVYETPHVLGTERTGPDLSNIGGKYPLAWHEAHHIDPRKVKPGSIMPSFSYLTDSEMKDLVVYLDTIGKQRQPKTWLVAPQEIRDRVAVIEEKVNFNASASASAGRGIYQQNCAQCHGVNGRGNGPVSNSMLKKPANFTRPYYGAYDNAMWFWRISEGVAGTRMPRWGRVLSEESMAYLAAYLKTLPKPLNTPASEIEVTNYSQIDNPELYDRNYEFISKLNDEHQKPSYYGKGRGE
jgi:cbb3-type cytochrome c oxidase subunit II